MKRILLSLICLCSLSAFPQKIVENPGFAASTVNYVTVTRIELRDTCTILHFRVAEPAGQSIRISKESYIQPGSGGEKLTVTQAEGAKMDTLIAIPETGELLYRLYFPRIDPGVTLIDFGEGSANGSWFIYSLELVPVKHVSLFPEAIAGNWFRTDGSREWIYGFLDKALIYNGEVYSQIGIEKTGKGYQVTVNKGTSQLVFYAKPARNNNLLIGTDPGKLELFSRVPVIKPDWVLPDDTEFQLPVFKMDTAVYKGYINGYIPKLGKTGMVYVDDILANDQLSYLVQIAEDGTFEVKVPMNYPQSVIVSLLTSNSGVFLEPGKTTFNYLDLTGSGTKSKAGSSLFMGACARLNADLVLTEPLSSFNFMEEMTNINKMTQTEFRDWMLNVSNQQMDSLNRFIQTNPVCKQAIQIRRMGIPYQAYQMILSYDMYKENGSKRSDGNASKPAEKPDSTFYAFMPSRDLNSPLSLLTGGEYNSLINRMLFAECIRPKVINPMPSLKDSIEHSGIALSENEKFMLDRAASGKSAKGADVSQAMTDEWTKFTEKHKDLLFSISMTLYDKIYKTNLKSFFGINPGLVTDMVISQNYMNVMKSQMSPLTDQDMISVKRMIQTPFILDYLLTSSKRMAEKIEARNLENKTKTGFYINELPKVKADSLLSAILSKFPGKVIFIDFWATWCGPCREGIERMRPLKEEYAGKPVEFIYITGPSSPQKTYDLMVPDIKGQHYKLDKDGWNYLTASYKISGIPRYMLFDKSGKLINDNIGSVAYSNEELKKLLDTYL